jgi:hypothetical protein
LPPSSFGQQLRDLLRRVLQVVVDRDDHFPPPPSATPASSALLLAVVPHQVDPADSGIAFGKAARFDPSSVDAAVVDENELVVEPVEDGGHAVGEELQRPLAVVDRHDDGERSGEVCTALSKASSHAPLRAPEIQTIAAVAASAMTRSAASTA